MKKSFGVVGGDKRQQELAALLRRDGHTVFTYGLGEGTPIGLALEAEVIVLPLPLEGTDGSLNCREGTIALEEVFAALHPEQRILAGQVKPTHWEMAKRHGLLLEDYFRRETLTVANAAITAECALQAAMEESESTLGEMDCLVLGFGRIGKLLCHRLRGLGCGVAAMARKPEDLAWIRAYGYKAVKLSELKNRLGSFDLVFNTVPAMVLDGNMVKALSPRCLCVDLASARGIDPDAARERGVRCLWARGLPGKMAPHTAAKALCDTIYEILMEARGERP